MKCEARRVLPCGEATIRFEIYAEGDIHVCAIDQLDGVIRLKPKAWLSLVRGELLALEGIAKEAGCAEMRMAGRFTRKMLPDYEEYTSVDGSRCLKKRL